MAHREGIVPDRGLMQRETTNAWKLFEDRGMARGIIVHKRCRISGGAAIPNKIRNHGLTLPHYSSALCCCPKRTFRGSAEIRKRVTVCFLERLIRRRGRVPQ